MLAIVLSKIQPESPNGLRQVTIRITAEIIIPTTGTKNLSRTHAKTFLVPAHDSMSFLLL